MVSQGSEDKRVVPFTLDYGDGIRIRDENGVVVVEQTHRGKRSRDIYKVPAGWSVEHTLAQPQDGTEGR